MESDLYQQTRPAVGSNMESDLYQQTRPAVGSNMESNPTSKLGL